jgi:hypothetical protein
MPRSSAKKYMRSANYSTALKMEEIFISETLVPTFYTAQHQRYNTANLKRNVITSAMPLWKYFD